MKQFEYIIFDVDGVLIDSMPIWENSANLYLADVWGIDAPPQVDQDCATLSLLEAAAYIKALYPQITVSEEVLADGVAEFIRERYWKAAAKPGMQETIRTLYEQGFHLYLATASETENVRGVLSNLGVWECFEELFTCTDIGFSKSHVEFFEEVADNIGVPCEDLIMVEDSLHSMMTAKEAGLTVVGVYDEASVSNISDIRTTCDVYFETLDALIPWLDIV